MKTMYNGSQVALTQHHGEEPVCPRCERRNALIMTTQVGAVVIRECRDCHLIVGCIRHNPLEAKIITRSLGKTCSHCGSFAMVEENLGTYLFKCQDCSAPAVKY